MPKRVDVDDFMHHLDDVQRPHLERLRALSLAADPDVEETVHWNQPAYLKGGVRLWVLQGYKKHCSLRFPTHQFAAHVDEVTAAGHEAGEGFVKLPYDQPLPEDLCARLIGYRLAEFAETGSTWNG
ncbi:iron chaperone [Nocardioides bruguierae]|uniref:DUF1801 domain-containing protein n=1 Tax=Nocardioides bruguierae TaxID=2945102 RepID=A0A9X2IHI7_9ACTN|nr:DUF1801 domain-containing protein [Nocardioides bruguierae]MCL8025754.1 DUF1801 domain-containing protein [Nocardioides bruguierae]MCM0622644.1 DUF1801 domain-containing protein [Nocardioides bruguierae]